MALPWQVQNLTPSVSSKGKVTASIWRHHSYKVLKSRRWKSLREDSNASGSCVDSLGFSLLFRLLRSNYCLVFARQEAKSGNCSLKTNCLPILHLACWPWKTGGRLGLACGTQLANVWFRRKTSNHFYFCCLASMFLSSPSSCHMLTWSDLLGDLGGPGNADFQQSKDKRDFPNTQKLMEISIRAQGQGHGVSLACNWKSDIKRGSDLVILFFPTQLDRQPFLSATLLLMFLH